LLGEQTRPHKDLDVIMLLDDVVRIREILGHDGYGLIWLWEENRSAVDAVGRDGDRLYLAGCTRARA